jgi:chromate transporter
LTAERFGNLISISQLTPGPVGINTATYVGFLSGNFPGAAAATLGLVFPTFLLAGISMKFIIKYREHKVMKSILYGARLGAAALVIYAVVIFMELSLLKGSWEKLSEFPGISYGGVIIMTVSFVLIQFCKWQTVWVILFAGLLGGVLIPFTG